MILFVNTGMEGYRWIMWTLYHVQLSQSPIILLGRPPLYIVLLLSGLVVLAFFVSISGLISLSIRIRTLTRRNGGSIDTQAPPMPESMRGHIGRTAAREISRMVLLAVAVGLLSGAGGIAYGIHWQRVTALENRHHYTDVLIQARYDAKNFLLKPIGMEAWPATSCYALPWKAGERMKWTDYQQRDNCKDFTEQGSYVCYYDAQGHCIIFNEEIADARR